VDDLGGLYEGDELMLTTLHAQGWSGWMGDWLRELGASWAKVVNPPGGFVVPNVANSLVRVWTDDIDAAYISAGRAGGKAFVQHMAARWAQNPATAYELANEPDCNTNAGLANLREYTLGVIEEAARLGIKLCVLNLAEGNPHNNGTANEAPTIWKWGQLRPAVVAAQQAGMYLGRHCYWRPGVEGPTGRWHALGRLEWDLGVLDVPGLRVLVNECGIDGGIAGHPGQQGWQVLTTEALYRGEVVEAERYARRIAGVEALAYFGFGAQAPWQTFDIPEGFARGLVAPLKVLDVAELTPEDGSGHLRIELARPLAYTATTNKVTQWFGANPSMYAQYGLAGHNGLDYRAPEGTPVLAMHSGIARIYDQGVAGLGRYVKVAYLDGRGVERYVTRYAHLSQWRVTDGQRVRRGDVLGLSGNTGNSTGAHLHVDLKVRGMVNPAYGDAIDFTPWRTV
jgi:murein DD-endopeptidase MepM/ murein hydrolase activator NlpD